MTAWIGGPLATQAQRTEKTRGRIIDATLDALVARGWDQLSTVDVCARAGVSRGAMLHHFPTKATLVAGAIEHLFDLRHGAFRARLADLPEGDLEAAFDALWQVYRSGISAAWTELVVAARTDPEVREQLVGINARFIAEAQVTFKVLFPTVPDDVLAPATRLVLATFDGLATNRILEDDDQLAGQVIALLRGLVAPWVLGDAT